MICVLCQENEVYEDDLCRRCYNDANDETIFDGEIQARLDIESQMHNKKLRMEVK